MSNDANIRDIRFANSCLDRISEMSGSYDSLKLLEKKKIGKEWEEYKNAVNNIKRLRIDLELLLAGYISSVQDADRLLNYLIESYDCFAAEDEEVVRSFASFKAEYNSSKLVSLLLSRKGALMLLQNGHIPQSLIADQLGDSDTLVAYFSKYLPYLVGFVAMIDDLLPSPLEGETIKKLIDCKYDTIFSSASLELFMMSVNFGGIDLKDFGASFLNDYVRKQLDEDSIDFLDIARESLMQSVEKGLSNYSRDATAVQCLMESCLLTMSDQEYRRIVLESKDEASCTGDALLIAIDTVSRIKRKDRGPIKEKRKMHFGNPLCSE